MDKGQLSPSQTGAILRELGHSPNRNLGQNFLVDSNIVRKSLDLAEVSASDIVVEVGPGLGTLTGALLERAAKVYAVELDARLFSHLEKTFEGNDKLDLLNADAVEYPLGNLGAQNDLEFENFKIVANLPYAISTPWMDAVLSGRLPKRMVLMLQKEAALRFAARSPGCDYSPISIFLGAAYDAKASHKVSASCFYPRPSVDSVLLSLHLKEKPFIFSPHTKVLVRKVFSTRRKQIAGIAKNIPEMREIFETWLAHQNAPTSESRPETISPAAWMALDEIVRNQMK